MKPPPPSPQSGPVGSILWYTNHRSPYKARPPAGAAGRWPRSCVSGSPRILSALFLVINHDNNSCCLLFRLISFSPRCKDDCNRFSRYFRIRWYQFVSNYNYKLIFRHRTTHCILRQGNNRCVGYFSCRGWSVITKNFKSWLIYRLVRDI